MAAGNTLQSFGSVTRTLHWLMALIIFTAIPLGLVANRLPYDTAEALARKAQIFSLHKTLGVAAFLLALARIGWALIQPRPVPLHTDRRVEITVAAIVHWLLYISLLVVPLSGWVHHAAVTGFAPILWPFGQTLPFVPQSEMVATAAASAHWVFTKLLAVAILLHVAGALKHHLVDRDATLRRMLTGVAAPERPGHYPSGVVPAIAALAIYAAGAGLAAALLPKAAGTQAASPVVATAGNWQVTEGSLSFEVIQMGGKVPGSFATWSAEILFDETPTDGRNGNVAVTIDTTSLALGAVTKQAADAEFFDVANHPTALFKADILPESAGYVADGTLTLRGLERPVRLPFSLAIDGDTARMTGTTTLDRRDFGMGPSYPDEASIGFGVTVTVALTAVRQ
ncbi:MAG: cytochrome [Tabrizicola sp.]|nr:cytochrome [Tabrizicola sp.]